MRLTTHFTDYREWAKAARAEGYTVRGPFIITGKVYDYAAYDSAGYKQAEFDDMYQRGTVYTYPKSST